MSLKEIASLLLKIEETNEWVDHLLFNDAEIQLSFEPIPFKRLSQMPASLQGKLIHLQKNVRFSDVELIFGVSV